MNSPHKHDPVNALAEEDATGNTAEIFKDIREVMQIPFVTSIWRTLAGVEDGLETVWKAARPLFLSRQPDAILEKLESQIQFPVPNIPPDEAWGRSQAAPSDIPVIRSILNAYTRSNSLNLIALTALTRPVASETANHPIPPSPHPWPALPKLLGKTEISSTDWKLLETITPIGAALPNPGMPTIWRHLIYWPELVRTIRDAYQPLHDDGILFAAIEDIRQFVESESTAIASYGNSTDPIPDTAREMVCNYIGKPPSVCRMTTFGQSVCRWLESE